MIFYYIAGFFALVILFGFYTVSHTETALLETFGKFTRVTTPGLRWRVPLIQQIKGKVSLRVQQLDVAVETKTHDDVFVHLNVSVQFQAIPSRVYQAFYTLQDPQLQIKSYVFDVVRAKVPNIKLNDVFEKKDEIAISVKKELSHTMSQFGWGIVMALVTDIDPDQNVKHAMNEITAAQRLRIAATEKGEADRIIRVKAAEAEAQSKALQGQGTADQRKAIVDGLRESIDDFQKSIPDSSADSVMNLVLVTQYFDALKDIAANNKSNTVLVPHSPSVVSDLQQQIRDLLISSQTVTKNIDI